jgi:hypothetical protein
LLGAAYASNGFDAEADVALENASLLAPTDGRWVYARGVLAQKQKRGAVALRASRSRVRAWTTATSKARAS